MDPRQGVHNKGSRLDSTPQSWPPIAPKDHGAERTRGRCLGRTEEPVGIHGAVPCHLEQTAHCRPQCCQKHDVVVKLSLPSVCWQEEPPATQDTCRLVAEVEGEAAEDLCLLPSALCPLSSALYPPLCPLPSALCPHSGFVPSSKLRCSAWKVVAIVWRPQGPACNRAPRPRSELCVRH
jgi:hypothetical protein